MANALEPLDVRGILCRGRGGGNVGLSSALGVVAGALAFGAVGVSLLLAPTVGLFMVPAAIVLVAAARAPDHSPLGGKR